MQNLLVKHYSLFPFQIHFKLINILDGDWDPKTFGNLNFK